MTSRRAFTLIELLVVMSIIALLIALTLPSLARAKEAARDIRCGSTQRQAIVAVMTYNADTPRGMWNNQLKPAGSECPFWGQAWPDQDFGPHSVLGGGGSHGPHIWNEGRSGSNYWRGFLQAGNYAPTTALGCNANDYTSLATFDGSYNTPGGASVNNHVETVRNAATFRKNPAYIWWGPGIFNADNVATYVGSNLQIAASVWGVAGNTLAQYTVRYEKRGPLFACPLVFVERSANLHFEPSHRPLWRTHTGISGSNLGIYPWAGNVGYTDGSVKFFATPTGAKFNPL